jgi:DNA-binding transcriptional ArsR family regulator
VAKRSDTTYSHTSETLRLLESAGLVCCVSRGREQLFRLTESGVRVCCLFDEELGVVGKQFYDDKKGLL